MVSPSAESEMDLPHLVTVEGPVLEHFGFDPKRWSPKK